MWHLCVVVIFSGKALAKEKVILDTDMVEAFDDGIAMLLLLKDPNIDLLGVCTITGNSWVEEGTAYTVKQLAIEGRLDVPIMKGLEYPLRASRHANFDMERKMFGMGHDGWVGSFGIPRPASWQAAYKQRYGEAPAEVVKEQHAVDFIIDTVRKNPNEVTIAAIGPCGNLALAVRKAPDIVPLIKKVVYMGGSFYKPGNVTPAAEFNWWFDPEATKIALHTPFKEQIIVGLDVCENVIFTEEQYNRFKASLGNSEQVKILKNTFLGQNFEKNPNFKFFIWDVLVSAIIIDPSLVTQEKVAYVDINTDYGLSYGQSLAYPVNKPVGAQKARIVMEIDQERFWDMLNDKKYWK